MISERSETYVYNGYDLPKRAHTTSSSGRARNTSESRSEFEISRLLKDAPADSIRQTINVEREEEEIIGPLGEGEQDVESMLNFDTVSEKVDLGMKDGTAQVSVKVRCERVVPILGVRDMFKKSSVIVTRLIEIDLLATSERQRLYEHIQRKSHAGAGGNMLTANGERSRPLKAGGRLSTKETFKLYKTFMGMAEADEAGKSRDNIRIDRRVEEQSRPQVQADFDFADTNDLEFEPDDLEQQLEAQMIRYAMRPPEPDTISFMSALSETQDMMY